MAVPRIAVGRRSRGGLAGMVALIGLVLATLVLVPPRVGPASAAAAPAGYWLLGRDGQVYAFGRPSYGSASSPAGRCLTTTPNGSCFSIAATADGGGYWILNADTGQVYTFGDAVSYGQPADTAVFQAPREFWPKAMEIVATRDGRGYWVLEHGLSDLGSVQGFGDARTYGDETTVAQTIPHNGFPVALMGTADNRGYWIVDSDGGVFSFGDAHFYGSMGGARLNAVVDAAAATRDHQGYWLAAADGGVFSFGDAAFGGSLASLRLNGPIQAIAVDPTGPGYWLAGVDGGIFAMGGASYLGSEGGRALSQAVAAMASAP